jgi:hypothetical protein
MRGISAMVDDKMYGAVRRLMFKNGHTWRQIVEAGMKLYRKGELKV